MIIKIMQTASNIKQTYDIESDGCYSHGQAGNLSRLQKITISNDSVVIKGIHKFTQWYNYIPLRYLFGTANLTRFFQLYCNETFYGSIVFSKQGLYQSFYVIASAEGVVFHCYSYSKGSFDYISIYKGDKQVALVETYLSVNDYKYTHKLYLLDQEKQFANTLTFFVLYYANYHFLKRFHMSKVSISVKAWSITKYKDKYDPNWRETHFKEENFFGKTNLFKE